MKRLSWKTTHIRYHFCETPWYDQFGYHGNSQIATWPIALAHNSASGGSSKTCWHILSKRSDDKAQLETKEGSEWGQDNIRLLLLFPKYIFGSFIGFKFVVDSKAFFSFPLSRSTLNDFKNVRRKQTLGHIMKQHRTWGKRGYDGVAGNGIWY